MPTPHRTVMLPPPSRKPPHTPSHIPFGPCRWVGGGGGKTPVLEGQKAAKSRDFDLLGLGVSGGGLAGDPRKHQKVREPSQRLGRKVPKNTLFRGLSTPPKPPEKPQKRGFSAIFALIFHAKMTPRAHPPHRGDFPGTESPELGVWVGGEKLAVWASSRWYSGRFSVELGGEIRERSRVIGSDRIRLA